MASATNECGKVAHPTDGMIGAATRVPFGGNRDRTPTTPHRAALRGFVMPYGTLEDRFWAKVDKSGDCWIWTGARNERGYGKILAGRRLEYAHRVSVRLDGREVPDNAHVCHHCDNPPCVNPAHLFVGTSRDNHDDMVRKGRSTRGERNPRSKLTADQVREIRARAAAGEVQRVIGADYGIEQSHVSLIVRRGVWQHLPPERA